MHASHTCCNCGEEVGVKWNPTEQEPYLINEGGDQVEACPFCSYPIEVEDLNYMDAYEGWLSEIADAHFEARQEQLYLKL